MLIPTLLLNLALKERTKVIEIWKTKRVVGIYSWEPMIDIKKNCEQANTKRNLRREMRKNFKLGMLNVGLNILTLIVNGEN